MKLIKRGATRWVLLIGNYAVKFPSLYSYRHFLQGLLGNHLENYWWNELKHEKLCPVIFCSWGCWMLIMPRVQLLGDSDEVSFYLNDYIKVNDDFYLPVELKPDSFGWLNGRLVAIDYGS